MWILFGGNYENADYAAYYYTFNSIDISSFFSLPQIYYEPGFLIFMKLAALAGFSYNHFLMLLSFVGLSLIAFRVEQETPKPELVYLLYLIYPFFFDIVQIRFFLATAIFVYSLGHLTKQKKNSSFKFLLGMFVSLSFHISAALYIPLVFLQHIKTRRILILSITLSLAGFVLLLIAPSFFDILMMLRVAGYFNFSTNVGYFFYISTQIGLVALIFKSQDTLKKNGANSRFTEVICKLNAFSILFFPLYVINSNFIRLYRMILIPTYTTLSIALAFYKPQTRFLFLIKALSLVTIIGFVLVWHLHNHSVFTPIIEKNIFWLF